MSQLIFCNATISLLHSGWNQGYSDIVVDKLD